MPPPAELLDELLEEVFLRLPPDEPEHLVRASSVCKPWRRILADAGFRRRYRRLHGTPPVLGLFHNGEGLCNSRFVPTSAFRPAEADLRSWIVLDCRHGRALFLNSSHDTEGFQLVVWDPMTGDERRVPLPDMNLASITATVLCAAEGCDHNGCQGQVGPFRLAVISTSWVTRATSACLYSSETGLWSELTSVQNVSVRSDPAALVGDALYFNSMASHVIKYQLATLDFSVFEKPTVYPGRLITAEDGGLGFASVNGTNLTLWSSETGPDGAVGWAKHRVIDLMMLLPDGAFLTTTSSSRPPYIMREYGFLNGTQVIFVGTYVGIYMVELKSGRAKKVLEQHGEIRDVFPYASFCIQAMEANSTGQGQ